MYYVHVAYSVIKAFDANFYRRGTSKLLILLKNRGLPLSEGKRGVREIGHCD